MSKHYYILELNGFDTEEDVQDFLNGVFAPVKWQDKQSMGLAHLTEKGVADLKKHILKQTP